MFDLTRYLGPLFPRKHPSELLEDKKEDTLDYFISLYNNAEGEEEKEFCFKLLAARLPKSLYLASVCFPGDDPSKPIRDMQLHTSPGAKTLYDANYPTVFKGNPGFRLSKKESSEPMHLRTLVSKSSGQSWIPLFSDFTRLIACFGIRTRVALFTIQEVKAMCQPGQGILINPGENPLPLTSKDLYRIV